MNKIKHVILITLVVIISACDTRTNAEKEYDKALEQMDRDLDRILTKGKRDMKKAERGEPMEYYRKCKDNSYGETICTTEYGYPD